MKIPYILKRIKLYGIKNALQRGFKKFVKTTYPVHINVEIMTVCNLKCPHCRVSYYGKTIQNVNVGFMDFELFKKIIDRLSPLVKRALIFQLSTIEPLFHKRIFDMMDYVVSCNKDISFLMLSNAMLLNEENIRRLCRYNIPGIAISLDGSKKEIVESFKSGVDFDKVTHNIRLLKNIVGKRMEVSTTFVATTENIHELEEYIDFCHDLGIDNIIINGFMSFLPEMSHLCLYRYEGNTEALEIFQKAYEKAKKAGIDMLFPNLVPEPRGCGNNTFMFVSEKGDVSPCQFLAYDTPLEFLGNAKTVEPIVFGNVLKDDPLMIWKSDKYLEFREKLRKGVISEDCSCCAEAYGVIFNNRKMSP